MNPKARGGSVSIGRLTRHVAAIVPSVAAIQKINSRIEDAESRERAKFSDPRGLYCDQHRFSAAFANLAESPRGRRCVNVVLPEFHPNGFFAGIRTALELGAGVALRCNYDLRVIVLRNCPRGDLHAQSLELLSVEFDFPLQSIQILSSLEVAKQGAGANDVWFATHWTTAHALEVSCRLAQIDPSRVYYLVQDFEAGFYPWSDEYALAVSTLHNNFRIIANSTPVSNFLYVSEGVRVSDNFVFAPALDLSRLEKAAEVGRRQQDETVRVLFYGRPSKPRNMFKTGCAAAKLASAEVSSRGIRCSFVSVGEMHSTVQLAGSEMMSKGKLPWDLYFDELARADVVMSLQFSPHPSHPPLDAVVSGISSVTNELDGTRTRLDARLRAGPPDATSLATLLVDEIERAHNGGFSRDFSPAILEKLGFPLCKVTDHVAESID